MGRAKYKEWLEFEEIEKLNYEETKEMLGEKQRYYYKGKEKDFQKYFIENIEEICGKLELPKIKQIQEQKRYAYDGFTIQPDIIVNHDDDTYTVFELKCSNYRNPMVSPNEQLKSLGQLLLYKSVLKARNGVSPRLFLVDTKIHKKLMMIYSEMDIPVSLVEIQNDRVFVPYRTHKE